MPVRGRSGVGSEKNATRLQELSECADWGPLGEGMGCDLVLCCVYGMSATGCWAARCNRVMIERLYEM